jgi:hypothetical protein
MIEDLRYIDFTIKNSKWRIFRLRMKVLRMLFTSKSFIYLNVKIDRINKKYAIEHLWRGLTYSEIHQIFKDIGQNCLDMDSIDKELESIRKEIKI